MARHRMCSSFIWEQKRKSVENLERWGSSLTRVFPVCYSAKHFVISKLNNQYFIWGQKEKSVGNFRTFTLFFLWAGCTKLWGGRIQFSTTGVQWAKLPWRFDGSHRDASTNYRCWGNNIQLWTYVEVDMECNWTVIVILTDAERRSIGFKFTVQ